MLKRFVGAILDMKVPYQIAIGNDKPKAWSGYVLTRERKKKVVHVDWWLYENATPYDEFEVFVDFENRFLKIIFEKEMRKNAGIC